MGLWWMMGIGWSVSSMLYVRNLFLCDFLGWVSRVVIGVMLFIVLGNCV